MEACGGSGAACWAVDAACWGVVTDEHLAPNGVLLSPDESTLYVSDVWSGAWKQPATAEMARRVVRYSVQHGADGAIRVSDRRVFFDLF